MFTSSNHAAHNSAPPQNYPVAQNGHAPPPSPHSNTNPLADANGEPHVPTPHQSPPSATQPRETVNVVGVPAVSIQNGKLVVGDASSSSPRSYTPIKTLGDGSFGTVLLCDWHGTLPPNTPLSPMQCGGGARPEWAGKRLVAIKRMKKKWEGGWDECKKLKELESLRAIPFHPCIIPLYDFFLMPGTKELYFVFESMEGNLYHLIKTRKGRPLAGGLVASIFRQIVSGLHHIHSSGYFHRDMKPENVLVTTTGLFEYRSLSPLPCPISTEKDVVVIIKLADFGLARETLSAPPYTEYVSTRWYRAPEVLMLSRDYSNPVDMWALGTIMAELVNLRPLFPGSGHVDQIHRICEVLGDPADYGSDVRGKPLGGGKWAKGLRMAKQFNFAFPKSQPKDIYPYFERTVPRKLIECIADLLKYDPDLRLTSRQCLEHPYLIEALPQNVPPMPPALYVQTLSAAPSRPYTNGAPFLTPSGSPRSIPPSHSHNSLPRSPHVPTFLPTLHPPHFPDASSSHRTAFVPSIATSDTHTLGSHKFDDHSDLHIPAQPLVPPYGVEEARAQHVCLSNHPRNGVDWMDTTPSQMDPPPEDHRMDFQATTIAPPRAEPEPMHVHVSVQETVQAPSGKLSKFGSLGFGKKQKWGLGMFGHGDKVHQQSLPPVDEVPGSSSMPSLKRTQSTGSDTHMAAKGAKANRKEAERLQREAEKQRRVMAERAHREQARAVMQKRNQMLMQTTAKNELEWRWSHTGSLLSLNSRGLYDDLDKNKAAAAAAGPGPIRQNQNGTGKVTSPTLHAASGRFLKPPEGPLGGSDRLLPRDERLSKVRRRNFDDDHSMSSSDIHSTGRMSAISFATVDSDPGPARIRRPVMAGINRMTSTSSLRTGTTSFDDFPTSARSSNSISLDHQFNEFNIRASVDTTSSVSGTSSPPPINLLSLSPSPNSWIHSHNSRDSVSPQHSSYMGAPMIQYPSSAHKSYECNGMFGHPPSPAIDAHVVMNPIFKVQPPLTSDDHSPHHSLPPFSQLEAVAEGEYPPLSPMSFQSSEDS